MLLHLLAQSCCEAGKQLAQPRRWLHLLPKPLVCLRLVKPCTRNAWKVKRLQTQNKSVLLHYLTP